MTDELDDLKRAMEAATPAPDPLKKRDNIALAEKNFADLQGSRNPARPTLQTGPQTSLAGRLLNGVQTMFQSLTTRGALTASTALVAVGLLVILPNTDALISPQPALDGTTKTTESKDPIPTEQSAGSTDTTASKATLEEPGSPATTDATSQVETRRERAELDDMPMIMEEPAPEVFQDTDGNADTRQGEVELSGDFGTRPMADIAAEPMMEAEESLAAPAPATRVRRNDDQLLGGVVAGIVQNGVAQNRRAKTGPTSRDLLRTPRQQAETFIAPADPAVITPESDTEAFANAPEGPLKVTTEDPVSTFSIDVDTASYSVVRQSLMSGRLPPKDAVRVEEIINYFPYDYAAPEGPHPFQSTITVAPTPWNAGTNLVHIGIQGTLPDVEYRPPLNLVFLIDTSGSMQHATKLPLLKQSFRLMLAELRPADEVSIVTYAGSAGQVLEPTPAGERQTILAALDRLEAGGSTAGQAGLQQAYQVAESMAAEGEVTRVLLATDGDFNVGLSDPEALKDFIAKKRDTGTYLSVLGFGRGNLDDATMQALAQNGNGQAAYIDTLSEARKVLVDQLTGALFPIANDVKIQVEFNPAQIAEYRLIGYETRALNREDFANDRVDAGDIGAGHRVTAIYEVTPVGSDAIRNGPLRYAEAEATEASNTSDELGFFKLRYKRPGETTSTLVETPIQMGQGSADTEVTFSIAMAGFGDLLRGSGYLGGWTYADAIALATGAKGEDPYGYRAEAVTLMRLAESLWR